MECAMSTKPPSAVNEFPPESVEKRAYLSVNDVPTVEPNDRNRLGYHVWRWLTTKRGTLEDAVHESGARLSVPEKEALATIREALTKLGIPLS
jgi:hypothetical protein